VTASRRTSERSLGGLELHPATALLPPASSEVLEQLRGSMREHGYDPDQPVTLHQGRVLDGAARLRIAVELGLEPSIVGWSHEYGSPEVFFFARNVQCRYASQDARAAAAARFAATMVARSRHRRDARPPRFCTDERSLAVIAGTSRKRVERARRVHDRDPKVSERLLRTELTLPEAEAELGLRSSVLRRRDRRPRPALVVARSGQRTDPGPDHKPPSSRAPVPEPRPPRSAPARSRQQPKPAASRPASGIAASVEQMTRMLLNRYPHCRDVIAATLTIEAKRITGSKRGGHEQ